MRSDEELLALARSRLERGRKLQLESAAVARSGGRLRYLVLRGAVQFGGMFLALGLWASTTLAPGWAPPSFSDRIPEMVGRIAVLLPPAVTLGVVVAVRSWRRFERIWFPLLDRERAS